MAYLKALFFLALISVLWRYGISEDHPIQEVLGKYGLPIGLLPSSVKSYSLSKDGFFEVNLKSACYVEFLRYHVYYEEKVTGSLSYGKITDLAGVRAKKLVVWVKVEGIEVDLPNSEYIYLKIGIITKKLEISEFKIVHECEDSSSRACSKNSLTAIQ